MKRTIQAGRSITLLLALQVSTLMAFSQTRFSGNSINLVVKGTSTLHDWDMRSVRADCNAIFTFNGAGQVAGLTSLNFSTPATALKSEHSAMDNNAYKALKTDQAPMISFTMTSVAVTPGANGASSIKCIGKLTIAGTTLDEDIVAICQRNADNTIKVTGTKSINMKKYNMIPPSFMFGAMKTGEQVTLSFDLSLKSA